MKPLLASLRLTVAPDRRDPLISAGLEDLDGHVPAEPRVPGAVDLSHPPCSQRVEDLVVAEPGACRESHVGCKDSRIPVLVLVDVY
jgi:hypothetical protein